MITIPEEFIKNINLAVLAFYIFFLIRGSKRGFVAQLIALIGSALSLFCAWRYCNVLSSFFHVVPKDLLPLQDTLLASTIAEYANGIAWFLLLFLAVRLLFGLIENMIGGFRKVPGVKQLSSFCGAALGVLLATVYIIVIGVVLNTSVFSNGSKAVKGTLIGTISDTVSATMAKQGLPVSVTEAVNEIYSEAQNLDDSDKKAVEDWLLKQGYRKVVD